MQHEVLGHDANATSDRCSNFIMVVNVQPSAHWNGTPEGSAYRTAEVSSLVLWQSWNSKIVPSQPQAIGALTKRSKDLTKSKGNKGSQIILSLCLYFSQDST